MLSMFNQPSTQLNHFQPRPCDIGAALRPRRRASDFVVVGPRVMHRSGRSGGEQKPRGSWGCALAAEKRQRHFDLAQRSMREQCAMLISPR